MTPFVTNDEMGTTSLLYQKGKQPLGKRPRALFSSTWPYLPTLGCSIV